MSKDPLLKPYKIKHLELRDRIIVSSHEPAYAEDGMPKDTYRAYHVERAYFELRPLSSNLGAVDYADLVAGKPQPIVTKPEGTFQLFRVGDAVSSRNTHAAILDALRFVRVA